MIERLSPDLGYMDSSALARAGASQMVVAAGHVHWSGIVAAYSTTEGMQIAAEDMAGQLSFVLDVLDRCLVRAGSDRTRVLTVTMFTTDLPALGASLPLFRDWVGEHRPALTTIGVSQLARPQLLLELQGTALVT